MNVVTRGVRNAFRNGIRTSSIVLILGLSIGLALSMLVATQAVQNKIESVKSSIGNTITVSPAGMKGFEGGGEPLTDDQIAQISQLDHVSSVISTLSDRLNSDKTDLEPAQEAGSLGKRFQMRADTSGSSELAPGGNSAAANMPGLPVMVTGTNSSDAIYAQASDLTIKSGQLPDFGTDKAQAAVGSELASKNNLQVGSTFTAYDTQITVAAIYDAGSKFANSGVYLPLSTLQRLSDQQGAVTSVTVKADSIANVDSVATGVKSAMGDSVDVVSQKDSSANALEPLENIKSVSLFSLFGAVAAGAVILLLSMIMIVRERRREIGVLKAIGASNMRVMFQFMSESVTLTLLGAVVGVIVGVLAANPLAQMLVKTSSSSATGEVAGRMMGGGPRTMMGNFGQNIQSINATVSWDIVLYGFLVAIVIAIVGSAVSSWLISRIRPAEVLRAE